MSNSKINFSSLFIIFINIIWFGIFYLLIASQKPNDKYMMALLQTVFMIATNGAIALVTFLFSLKVWKKWRMAAIISFFIGVVSIFYYLF